MTFKTALRILAWLLLAGLIFATLAPIDMRPNSPLPTGAERAFALMLVGFVFGPDGRVTQTRIEAPRYLVDQGLAGCVRPVLRELRFPAAGKDTVVKVPFDIG